VFSVECPSSLTFLLTPSHIIISSSDISINNITNHIIITVIILVNIIILTTIPNLHEETSLLFSTIGDDGSRQFAQYRLFPLKCYDFGYLCTACRKLTVK